MENVSTSSYNKSIKAVFIDEAHCMEAWGCGVHPFRKSYGNLASIHCLWHSITPFVALTATATVHSRVRICNMLSMINPAVIEMTPNKINLRYSVYSVQKSNHSRFAWLLEELRTSRIDTLKTIVFCRSIADCADLYQLFDLHLKEDGYIPRGKIHVKNALFGMYHAKITDEEKSVLLESFSRLDGTCRILFSTIAFGMGINIPNIYRIIHNGPPNSIEDYVQESGRGGRDGRICEVVLYLYSGCMRGSVSSEMKAYCRNVDICRRISLMGQFPGQIDLPSHQHLCCDLCGNRCTCNCSCKRCFCDIQQHPCFKCCTCNVKCTYSPLICVADHKLPLEFDEDEQELSDLDKSSESESYEVQIQ